MVTFIVKLLTVSDLHRSFKLQLCRLLRIPPLNTTDFQVIEDIDGLNLRMLAALGEALNFSYTVTVKAEDGQLLYSKLLQFSFHLGYIPLGY